MKRNLNFGDEIEIQGDIEIHTYDHEGCKRFAANIRNFVMRIYDTEGYYEEFSSNRSEARLV